MVRFELVHLRGYFRYARLLLSVGVGLEKPRGQRIPVRLPIRLTRWKKRTIRETAEITVFGEGVGTNEPEEPK